MGKETREDRRNESLGRWAERKVLNDSSFACISNWMFLLIQIPESSLLMSNSNHHISIVYPNKSGDLGGGFRVNIHPNGNTVTTESYWISLLQESNMLQLFNSLSPLYRIADLLFLFNKPFTSDIPTQVRCKPTLNRHWYKIQVGDLIPGIFTPGFPFVGFCKTGKRWSHIGHWCCPSNTSSPFIFHDSPLPSQF